jgi:DNA invertase Pin-like site-specific DNA recombinase
LRYIIFSRVSSNLQLDESQLFMCREYVNKLKKFNDEIIEFNEPPTSTRLKMEERPVLQSLFEFLKKGDNLVVFCLTRLARTGSEIVKIYEEQITNKKVILHSLGQPKVDKNFIHVYAMMGEMARDTISNNTKAGLRNKQAQMHKVGTEWYGYKTDPTKLQERENVKSTGKPYLLVPQENEQAQVEIMVRLHREGASYGDIVAYLFSEGHRNRKGQKVGKSTVFRCLNRLKKQDPTHAIA